MNIINVNENRSTIINLLRSTKKTGVEELICFLEQSDFFTAPASTVYHMSVPGGLSQHSINVYLQLRKINTAFELNLDINSMIICGLLHDVCKTYIYELYKKNVKNPETGVWETLECYKHSDKDPLPLGHGPKSLYIIQSYIQLSTEEAAAILFHMSSWDLSEYSKHSMNIASGRYNLPTALQMADIASTWLVEAKEINL